MAGWEAGLLGALLAPVILHIMVLFSLDTHSRQAQDRLRAAQVHQRFVADDVIEDYDAGLEYAEVEAILRIVQRGDQRQCLVRCACASCGMSIASAVTHRLVGLYWFGTELSFWCAFRWSDNGSESWEDEENVAPALVEAWLAENGQQAVQRNPRRGAETRRQRTGLREASAARLVAEPVAA